MSLFYFIIFLIKFNFIVLALPHINMNPPQVYTCSPPWPLLSPLSLYHPSGSSQCTSLKHPVSCIEPGLATCFIYDIIHVSMPCSQIIPPSPSPTESNEVDETDFCFEGSGMIWNWRVMWKIMSTMFYKEFDEEGQRARIVIRPIFPPLNSTTVDLQ